jgi:RNA polymerase sigma-70 factor, ECF subfamily
LVESLLVAAGWRVFPRLGSDAMNDSVPLSVDEPFTDEDSPTGSAKTMDAVGNDEPSRLHRQWVADSFVRYERPLLAYACRMLGGDFSAAQDAVQETFVRLCREDRAKIEARLAAWLFSVCRSRVIDMKRLKGVLPTSDQATTVVDAEPSPAAALEAIEQSDQMVRLLDELSPRQQEVLRLRLQAQLSYREIAEVTGLSVSNVGFHLHAAVRSLRTAMLGA